ncbi:MAG: 2Fe-2S iron-sulfur cluster binding domain-containing protein [Nitrospirae bacterium]|nr:2Fe-2S iron-sulfur cluster binding domain-containing protein [Nitrospirota bacterium]
MKKYRVSFEPFGKTIDAPSDKNLFDVARKAGIELNSSCGGEGTCGKCKVIVKEGEFRTDSTTKLSREEIAKGYVLACQTTALSNLSLEVPHESIMRKGQKIATGARARELERLLKNLDKEIKPRTRTIALAFPPPDLEDNISDTDRVKRELSTLGFPPERVFCSLKFLRGLNHILREGNWKITLTTIERGNTLEVIGIEAGDTTGLRYGLAIDIGTTTIVLYLVNLIDGKIIDVASTYNSQARCGDDVITRIVYATERGGLGELNSLVISDINGLLNILTQKRNINPVLIDSIVVSGNTTMTHLFFGIDPR